MTVPAERYTDHDLRRDPVLIGIAIGYARHYDGEFEPVLKARDEAIATGSLSLPMARTVLNCMRHDPESYDLLNHHSPHLRAVPDLKPARKMRRAKPEPPKRTYWLRTAVTIKYPYGIAGGKYGHKDRRVLHVVSEAWCDWQKYDYTNDRWLEHAIPKFIVRWACKQGQVTNPILIKSDDTLPPGGYCRSGCWETDRLTVLMGDRWIQSREEP